MVLIKPDEWHVVAERFEGLQALRILVCGGKGVGKSTFIRFMLEQLQSKYKGVCRLEADCGQPDHTAPGVLSLALYDSTSTRPKIVSQRFLGSVNPGTNPFTYVEAVSQVFGDYQARHSTKPLFVNMHGWSTGTGILTWDAVIQVVQPDFVVHIGKEGSELAISERNPLVSQDCPPPKFELIKLSPIIVMGEDEETLNWNKELASDRRWKRYASHFRPDLLVKDEFKSCHPKEFFLSPFVRLMKLEKRVLTVSFPQCNKAPSNVYAAINNTIVGLCNSESSQMICLGFVASVDDPTTVSVIIPPNIPEKFGLSINSIVRGEMNWSPRDRVCHKGKITSTDFLPPGCDSMPYFLPNTLVSEVSKTASTRTDLKRRRLMKTP